MSENVLTPAMWVASGDETDESDQDLPEPAGYRMLIKPYEIESFSKGGIVLVEESKQYADVANCTGQVVKQGPECYHPSKFDSRWCKVGDFVLFARNVGQKIDIKRADGAVDRYLMINDADVRAKVKDPTKIRTYL